MGHTMVLPINCQCIIRKGYCHIQIPKIVHRTSADRKRLCIYDRGISASTRLYEVGINGIRILRCSFGVTWYIIEIHGLIAYVTHKYEAAIASLKAFEIVSPRQRARDTLRLPKPTIRVIKTKLRHIAGIDAVTVGGYKAGILKIEQVASPEIPSTG